MRPDRSPDGYKKITVPITVGFPVFNGMTDIRCGYCPLMKSDETKRRLLCSDLNHYTKPEWVDPDCKFLKKSREDKK